MTDTSKAWDRGYHDELREGADGRAFQFTPWGTDGEMAEAYREGRRFAARKRKQAYDGTLYTTHQAA